MQSECDTVLLGADCMPPHAISSLRAPDRLPHAHRNLKDGEMLYAVRCCAALSVLDIMKRQWEV